MDIGLIEGDESKVDYYGGNNKTVKVLAIVGALVLIVAIIGLVVSTTKWKDTEEVLKHGHFGIIIDAGGTGTRLYVYEYKSDQDIHQVFVKKCEKIGLSNYGGKEKELQPLLNQCLNEAQNEVPDDVIGSTPLFMKATAGMRKLKLENEAEYEKIWGEVRKILNNGTFPVKIADTMSGKDEATYSWTTVNQLLGNKESQGIIEVGSTSIQIAFVPKSTSNLPKDQSSEVTVHGNNYHIYANSYLCLGKEEFNRRYFAKLIHDAGYTVQVADPCGNKGYAQNLTSSYLWEKPCVQGDFAKDFLGQDIPGKKNVPLYTLTGSGDYEQCQAQIAGMFTKICTKSSCGMLDVFQPKANGKYMAIGGAAYFAAKFLQLPSRFNLSIFDQSTKKLCESNVTQVEQRPGFDRFAFEDCLSNSFTSYLLHNVIKVDMTGPDGFKFANKINGEAISWTEGSIISDKAQLSPAKYETKRDMSDTTFKSLIAVFCIVLLVGLVLIVVAIVKINK